MSGADAPPPEDQRPGAPVSRLDAFSNELVAMIDRYMNEGGLDIAQVLGTIEWTKWRLIKHFDAMAAEAKEEGDGG